MSGCLESVSAEQVTENLSKNTISNVAIVRNRLGLSSILLGSLIIITMHWRFQSGEDRRASGFGWFVCAKHVLHSDFTLSNLNIYV